MEGARFGAEMHRTTSGPPPGIVHPQEKARLRQEELQRMEQQRAEEARLAAEAGVAAGGGAAPEPSCLCLPFFFSWWAAPP